MTSRAIAPPLVSTVNILKPLHHDTHSSLWSSALCMAPAATQFVPLATVAGRMLFKKACKACISGAAAMVESSMVPLPLDLRAVGRPKQLVH